MEKETPLWFTGLQQFQSTNINITFFERWDIHGKWIGGLEQSKITIFLQNNKDQLYSSRSTTSNSMSEERMGHKTLWDFSEPFCQTLPSSKRRIPSVNICAKAKL
jgi:hypothetical protein